MRELRRALKAIARRRGHAYISSHDPGTLQALATRPLVIVDEKSPYMGSFYPRCFSFRRRNEHRGGFDAAPEDTERLLRFLQDQPSWSASWDKAHGLWRAAEDDPHSSLYIESRDVETVIGYIAANA